jgi:hypothetical protein
VAARRGKMKARIAIAAALVLLWGARADAGIFGTKKYKLPAAASPVLNRTVKEPHAPGTSQRHPRRFNDPTWGALWKQMLYPDRNFQPSHWAKD